MNNRTLNVHLPIAIATLVLAWFALVHPLTLTVYLFSILTWGLVICMSPLFLIPKQGKKAVYESYRKGKHAPEWFDVVHYGTLAIMCAAFGHPWKAAAWVIIFSVDIKHRHEADYE